MSNSLWGSQFDLPKNDTSKLLNKVKKPKKVKTDEQILNSSTTSLQDKLAIIHKRVREILGVFEPYTRVIRTKEELVEYIQIANKQKVLAVDTETNNSLDPLTCKLMGLCIYTPGQKNVYVPINHSNWLTEKRLEDQLTEQDIAECLALINDDVKIIMHNAKFDKQVIQCTTTYKLRVDWDTEIGAFLLDENELRFGLKHQYRDKIDPTVEKYDITGLFKDVPYAYVDIDVFALYAATDAYETYKLYEYQKKQYELPEHKKLYRLFMEVEMPIVDVVTDMELTGVVIDKERAKRLSSKYRAKLDDCDRRINDELSKYKDKIISWRNSAEAHKKTKSSDKKTKGEQLKDPIELTSTTQLAILLYDILKLPLPDTGKKSTGEEELKKLNLPICDLILEKRGYEKLLGTYIDKIPECVSDVDGRLHCQFKQTGAKTGRFSSKNPNTQNIPSHEISIRMMFATEKGYTMIGSDFSQQEPRILASMAQDENMISAYLDGKDLYAVIASKVYNNAYEDNREFDVNGNMNPEGKHRRTSVKAVLLGILYGRGSDSIAEQLNMTKEEAEKLIDDFFKGFPKLKEWINAQQEFAKQNGYVEDLWGRRRRLPDIQVKPYEVFSKQKRVMFNPLLGTKGELKDNLVDQFEYKLNNSKNYWEYKKILEEIKNKGYDVKNNKGFISQAERQCVNAVIQGSAATMTKKAMIKVHNDERLKELGFKLLIPVHDELIGECPIENKELCKKYLAEDMIEVAKKDVCVPMKCDADDFPCWYYDVYSAEIKEQYKNGTSLEDLVKEHTECTREELEKMIVE